MNFSKICELVNKFLVAHLTLGVMTGCSSHLVPYSSFCFSMSDKEVRQQLRIAEIVNGRAAMLGFIAAIGTYLVSGQIIPGIF